MKFGALCIAAALLSFACGGDGDNGNVFQMDLDNGAGSVTLDASKTSGNFIIVPFSSPTNAGISGSANYSLQASGGASNKFAAPYKVAAKISPATKNNVDAATRDRVVRRIVAENERRKRYTQALKNFQQHAQLHGGLPIKAMYKQPPSFANGFGNSINLFSPFDSEQNQTIHGNLLANTADAAIYLDTRDASSLSSGAAAALLQIFAGISKPRVNTLVGSESDINNDGGVIIFVSSEMPSGTLGFFRPLDLLPDGVDPSVKSNEREILYTSLPQTSGGDPLFNATLAHEYFHLVNFATKSLPVFNASNGQNLLIEEVFLNEGQAHCIENLTGWGNGDTYVVAAEFLNNVNDASVAGSVAASLQGDNNSNDSLARRGAAMLLLRYLFEQEGGGNYSSGNPGDISGGGVDFFKKLTQSSQTGVQNIEAAAGISFGELFGNWVAALYIDGTNTTNDPRFNYEAIATDSFTNGFRGFDLRATQPVNGGSSNVTLNGPALEATLTVNGSQQAQKSGSIFLSGPNFLLLQTPAGSSSTLQYQTAANSSPGVTVIALP